MKTIQKSTKLNNVCYDIRGPVVEKARQMEEEGQKIIKLNIGNLAPFGFDAPEEVQQDIVRNLPNAAGYSDSKGIFAARKAVMHYTQERGIAGVTLDDIYLGNGASELITMSVNALLNDGDELLVPAPGWLSTTMLCPKALLRAGVAARKIVSMPEPAPTGKINFSVLSLCANAKFAPLAANKPAINMPTNARVRMPEGR